MSLTAAWVVVTKDQVQQYLTQAVVDAANELDTAGNERIDGVLTDAIARMRAAVGTGNRVPLSLTPLSVPPEGAPHLKLLVIEALVPSVPQLAQYVVDSNTLG